VRATIAVAASLLVLGAHATSRADRCAEQSAELVTFLKQLPLLPVEDSQIEPARLVQADGDAITTGPTLVLERQQASEASGEMITVRNNHKLLHPDKPGFSVRLEIAATASWSSVVSAIAADKTGRVSARRLDQAAAPVRLAAAVVAGW
jgi:hypothetical protein